jgi:hypothetical protein
VIDLIEAVAAVWLASGVAAWIALSDQRIQSREFEFKLDLLYGPSLCICCGPFSFWIARARLIKEEWL